MPVTVTFDPLDETQLADPFPTYRALRLSRPGLRPSVGLSSSACQLETGDCAGAGDGEWRSSASNCSSRAVYARV